MINRRGFIKFVGSCAALGVVPLKSVKPNELIDSDLAKLSRDLKEHYNSEISLEDWIGTEMEANYEKWRETSPDLIRGSGVVKKQGHFKEKNGKLYFIGGEK